MSKSNKLAAPAVVENTPRIGLVLSGLCFFSHAYAGSEEVLSQWDRYGDIKARLSAGGGTNHNAIVQHAQMSGDMSVDTVLSHLESHNRNLRRFSRVLNPGAAAMEDVLSARNPFEASVNFGRHLMLVGSMSTKASMDVLNAGATGRPHKSALYTLKTSLENAIPSNMVVDEENAGFRNYGTTLYRDNDGAMSVKTFVNPGITELLCGSALTECGGMRHPEFDGIFYDAGYIGNPPLLGDHVEFSIYDFVQQNDISDLVIVMGFSNSPEMRDLSCGMRMGEAYDDIDTILADGGVRTHVSSLDLDSHWNLADQTFTSPKELRDATVHAKAKMAEDLAVIEPNIGKKSTAYASELVPSAA